MDVNPADALDRAAGLLIVLALMLLWLAACQEVHMPACTSNCYVFADQTRGGNSPSTSATIPLIP
jgi:hypothetical protein